MLERIVDHHWKRLQGTFSHQQGSTVGGLYLSLESDCKFNMGLCSSCPSPVIGWNEVASILNQENDPLEKEITRTEIRFVRVVLWIVSSFHREKLDRNKLRTYTKVNQRPL